MQDILLRHLSLYELTLFSCFVFRCERSWRRTNCKEVNILVNMRLDAFCSFSEGHYDCCVSVFTSILDFIRVYLHHGLLLGYLSAVLFFRALLLGMILVLCPYTLRSLFVRLSQK